MAIIIDGYNLLHASDLFGSAADDSAAEATAFERSRAALIEFVSEAVGEKQRAETTIVFDAADAPPGLPNHYRQQGVMVRFARRQASADALIGDLIQRSRRPKQLLVVSSDHEVQRSARRRGAAYVDSQHWFAEQKQALRLRRAAARRPVDPVQSLREKKLEPDEVRRWLDEFGQ